MLNMESFEDSSALKGCTDLGRARIARAKALLVNAPRARGLVGSADLAASSPAKELDALVLGNSLIGYGDGISLENMMIIENLISFRSWRPITKLKMIRTLRPGIEHLSIACWIWDVLSPSMRAWNTKGSLARAR